MEINKINIDWKNIGGWRTEEEIVEQGWEDEEEVHLNGWEKEEIEHDIKTDLVNMNAIKVKNEMDDLMEAIIREMEELDILEWFEEGVGE